MILTYDTTRYDFRTPAALACGYLGGLKWDGGHRTVDSDQETPWHAALYRLYDETGWLDVWRRFVAEWVVPTFGEGLAYQARPTWRVHPIGNQAIGPWHTDTLYGHGDGTTNLWVPLVDTTDANTLWVESKPITVRYGEVLAFDGVHQRHGNIANLSDRSRVSFDARIVPIASLQPGGQSFNTRTPLEVGGYYAEADALCLPKNSADGSTPHSSENSASSLRA